MNRGENLEQTLKIKKMKKISLLLFFSFVAMVGIQAQQSAVKLGLGGLFVTAPNLRFEQAIGDRMSFQITGSYKFPANLNFSQANNSDIGLTDAKLTGFAIIPEFRFYFGQANAGTIRGFYLAPYIKYHRYGTGTTATFDYTDREGQFYNLQPDLNVNLSTIGGGLQLGYQWVIGDHFSIDWHFLGLGGDLHRFKAKADFTNSDVDLKDVASFLIDEYNANSETPLELTEDDLENIPVDGKSINFNAPFAFVGFRAGISLGYAF